LTHPPGIASAFSKQPNSSHPTVIFSRYVPEKQDTVGLFTQSKLYLLLHSDWLHHPLCSTRFRINKLCSISGVFLYFYTLLKYNLMCLPEDGMTVPKHMITQAYTSQYWSQYTALNNHSSIHVSLYMYVHKY
jgi:hypothetical protein